MRLKEEPGGVEIHRGRMWERPSAECGWQSLNLVTSAFALNTHFDTLPVVLIIIIW